MSPPFSAALLRWFDKHGRHDLPWQHPRTPYRVWLAEIMLQQTQVQTVIPYYQRFLERFPGLSDLASATMDEVLSQWAGLGYYSRARNLHRCAQLCMEKHEGSLPNDQALLEALPGIGRSTAAAIRAQAYGERAAILDGNVKRVLSRFHGIDRWPGLTEVNAQLWTLAEEHTPHERIVDYTQAIMDLGASVCRRRQPSCEACPLTDGCQARQLGRQAEWPARAPRKTRPERHALLLWARDSRGRSLLQRRPPTGIWGGLWSLPELSLAAADAPTEVDLSIWYHELGIQALESKALPNFHHDFSHFRLHIHPLQVLVKEGGSLAEDTSGWFSPEELEAIGLPRPIARLLRTGS